MFTDDDTYFVPRLLVTFLGAYDDTLPVVVARGDPPPGLTYGRLGTAGTKGHTCTNPRFKVPRPVEIRANSDLLSPHSVPIPRVSPSDVEV